MRRAEFTITQRTWVGLVVASFMAWLAIITLVTLFAAYASTIVVEQPTVCRTEFGHRC